MSDNSPAYTKKKRSKAPLVIAVLAILAVAVTAVSVLMFAPSNKDSTGKELTISILLEPTNLNIRETAGVALDQVLTDNVYQGLVGFKSGTLEIEPVLASKYSVSDDGLVYSFELRDGVFFHSGNPLTTGDVVDSLTETIGDTAEIIADNENNTVTLTLAEPNSTLLRTLAERAGLILESAATNDLAQSANGTGPFTFEEWKQGDSITLAKNENYWGEPALLEKAIYRYIPDGKAAVNAALSGEVDAQIALLPSLRSEFDAAPQFNLVRAESTDVFTLAYNNQRAPLDNPRVRAALSMAIDSSVIIEALEGDGKPLGGPITEIEPGYEDLTAIYAYDPEQAKEILQEEGITDLSLTVTAPNIYDTVALDIVASQLQEVGVALTVQQVEFTAWLDDVYTNKDFDMSYVDHSEAFDFANYTNPDYYFGFDNTLVQSLFQDSLKATDDSEAAGYLAEAASTVADEAVAKWLYNYTPTNVVHEKVKNFPKSNTNSRINLAGVTIE